MFPKSPNSQNSRNWKLVCCLNTRIEKQVLPFTHEIKLRFIRLGLNHVGLLRVTLWFKCPRPASEHLCLCAGGFLCSGVAGWQPVSPAGYGLRDNQGQGNSNKGQWWCLVPCGHSERWTLRSVLLVKLAEHFIINASAVIKLSFNPSHKKAEPTFIPE